MAYVLTAKGREISVNRLKGSGTEPVNVGWGKNPATLTAAATDIALFAPAAEAKVAGTSTITTTTTTNDTYQDVATITSASAQTIAEVGMFDSATAPFTTTVASGAIIGSNSATTFTAGASYTPANGTYIQIRTEVLLVTAGTGTTSLTVTRAQGGTAAISTIAASDAVTAGNPAGNAGITGGSLFVHGDHGANTLAISDSVTYTLSFKQS